MKTAGRDESHGRRFSMFTTRPVVIAAFLTCATACTSDSGDALGRRDRERVIANAAWPSASWVPMVTDGVPTITVLFRTDDHEPFRRVRAMIDTGAIFAVVVPDALIHDQHTPGQAIPASDLEKPVEFRTLGEVDLEIAGTRINDVQAVSGPTPSSDEIILGDGVLRSLGAVLFDWSNGRFGTTAQSVPESPDGVWAPARVVSPSSGDLTGMLLVPATLDGVDSLAVLDTGSSGDVDIDGSIPDSLSEPERVRTASGVAEGRRLKRKASLHIGSVPFPAVRPFGTNTPGGWGQAHVVLGTGVLRQRPMWLDYAANAVRFWVPN